MVFYKRVLNSFRLLRHIRTIPLGTIRNKNAAMIFFKEGGELGKERVCAFLEIFEMTSTISPCRL